MKGQRVQYHKILVVSLVVLLVVLATVVWPWWQRRQVMEEAKYLVTLIRYTELRRSRSAATMLIEMEKPGWRYSPDYISAKMAADRYQEDLDRLNYRLGALMDDMNERDRREIEEYQRRR